MDITNGRAEGDGRKRTLPEALDAAQDGAEFGRVLQGLFSSLEAAIDAEKEEGKQ